MATTTVPIVNVAKKDRLRGAGGLTGGDDFAVANLPVFFLRLDLGGVDALHAVGAFFHDAAAAHRDVGISQRLQAWGFKIGILEKIKPAHFVRAIVGAIAGADAAVVNHVVQPLVAVAGGPHGANQFAGRVLAMHARDGLMVGLRIIRASFIIAVDAQPMHLPAAGHFGLADDRNIVFRLACDDAGVAADAGVDVDGHAPGVTFIFESRIKRALRFVMMLTLREVRLFAIFL